jgi:hypothetical protein
VPSRQFDSLGVGRKLRHRSAEWAEVIHHRLVDQQIAISQKQNSFLAACFPQPPDDWPNPYLASFGYSNLLATLSAIVSHEHFEIEPGLYSQILGAVAGDTEFKAGRTIGAEIAAADLARFLRCSVRCQPGGQVTPVDKVTSGEDAGHAERHPVCRSMQVVCFGPDEFLAGEVVIELSKQRFDCLAGYARHPRLITIIEEAAWIATDDERVLGLVTGDRIDDDFGWVALGRDERLRYRAVQVRVGFATRHDAEASLKEALGSLGDALPRLAADLVQVPVDVLFTMGTRRRAVQVEDKS